jgi:type IV pilus assembly protein PilE
LKHSFRNRPGSGHHGGFTLIELMIAVAIVGILAAIALPAYQNSIIKGRRAQGRTALLELAQAQERYFTANNQYQLFATGASVTGMKSYSGDTPTGAAYLLSATSPCTGMAAANPEKQCVMLTAIPQFTDAQAASLTLQSTGAKSCTGLTPNVCWP